MILPARLRPSLRLAQHGALCRLHIIKRAPLPLHKRLVCSLNETPSAPGPTSIASASIFAKLRRSRPQNQPHSESASMFHTTTEPQVDGVDAHQNQRYSQFAKHETEPYEYFSGAIDKPTNDDREYRLIGLTKNGLEALLISDPKTDKAAADSTSILATCRTHGTCKAWPTFRTLAVPRKTKVPKGKWVQRIPLCAFGLLERIHGTRGKRTLVFSVLGLLLTDTCI